MEKSSHVLKALVCFITLVVFSFSSSYVSAQSAVSDSHADEHNDPYADSLVGFNTDAVMRKATSLGLNPFESAMYLANAKRSFIDQKYQLATVSSGADLASMRSQNQVAMAPCTNMDFETGTFSGWSGSIGDNNLSSSGPLQNIVPGFFSTTVDALVSDCNARHTIITAASGNDPCGGFSCLAPGGNYSVRLGNTCALYQGEIIEQTFTVGIGNTSFTYQYAVVLNDGGHSAGEQPYFKVELLDQSGNLIPCGQYYVEASGSIPGFVSCGLGTFYKPWTVVSADLTAYLNQNVTIRFTAAGCIYGGHYGYAYIDASCLQYIINQSDSLCAGSSITLTAPIGAQSYLWSTGDTTQSIVVSTAGSYSVTLTSVTGCQTTLTQNVSLYPQPLAGFTPNFAPCSTTYAFGNTSTIGSGTMIYQWDFGDPNITYDTSSSANPTFIYPTPGNYVVTLIATSASGCIDTITLNVSPGSAGLANFQSTTVCVGQLTNFTDQSINPTSWNWHFNDPASGPADSSNVQNPTHTFTQAGTYNVTLVVGGNPCPSTIIIPVIVHPLAQPSFVYNQNCGNQLVNFTSTSTVAAPDNITSTSWDFGDPASGPNNTSILLNPSHTFSAPGTYVVTLVINTNNNCPQTITQQIVVGLPPTAAFTANTVCTNSPMQFTDQSINTVNWTWNFGDGATLADTSHNQNPSYTYLNPGVYTVTLIANPGNCSDTMTLQVNVAPGPQPAFIAPQVCEGTLSGFTDQSTISSGTITNWHWDFGVNAQTNDTSNIQNPNFSYPISGTYTVTLTCTSNNGCVTTITQPVIVNALPASNFSSNIVCVGAQTTFTDLSTAGTGNITSWTWDFGDGSPSSTQQNPTHIYNNDSTYNVTLIVQNAAGCIDTISLQAMTASMPVPLFLADTLNGCPILCVNFTDQTTIASGAITGWTWDFGDGMQAYTQNPSHCYSIPGTYTVTLSATSNGACVSTLTMPNLITVYPVPTANFAATPPITTVLNTVINFTDLSGGNPVIWTWNFGDPSTSSDSSSQQNPQYTYSNEYGSIYPVYMQVTNQYGCVDDTTIEVIVEPDFTFFIPNAFTPNGDGVNDGFFGTGIGINTYQIWVFDRWGNMIFESNDMNKAWDGRVQGHPDICQQDVYVWKVVLTDVFNKKHTYVGHVSLVK
jgi:gliding motility-associated-like protein